MFKVKLLSISGVLLALLAFNLHAVNTEPIPNTPEQRKETMTQQTKPKQFPEMDWKKKNNKKAAAKTKQKEFPGLEWKNNKSKNKSSHPLPVTKQQHQ